MCCHLSSQTVQQGYYNKFMAVIVIFPFCAHHFMSRRQDSLLGLNIRGRAGWGGGVIIWQRCGNHRGRHYFPPRVCSQLVGVNYSSVCQWGEKGSAVFFNGEPFKLLGLAAIYLQPLWTHGVLSVINQVPPPFSCYTRRMNASPNPPCS